MDHDPLPGDHPETGHVSTGALPPDTDVQALISAGYERYRHLGEGAVADYIPALAAASPSACDQFFAAADGSSESGVGPPAGVVLPGLADERVSLLPVTLGECERLGRAAVMLAGLLDVRVRWHEPRSRSAGLAGPQTLRSPRAPALCGLLIADRS